MVIVYTSPDGQEKREPQMTPTWRLSQPWLVTLAKAARSDCPAGGSAEVIDDNNKVRYRVKKSPDGALSTRWIGGKPT